MLLIYWKPTPIVVWVGDALISGNSMALAVDWRIPFKERENATKN